MSSTPIETPPPADHASRDDVGRLVAIDWNSGATAAAPASGRWLAAIDGSDCSLRAVAMAVRLAHGVPGAVIDLAYVHPWRVKEAAEAELPQRGWDISTASRAYLSQAGIGWRLHVRMGDAATELVALAASLGSRGIVIGSHGLTAMQSLMLGSVAYKVVHLSAVPVMIVR